MKFSYLSLLAICTVSIAQGNEPVTIQKKQNTSTLSAVEKSYTQETQQLAELYGDFSITTGKLNLLIESLAGIVSQTNLVKASERSTTLEWLQDARKQNQALIQAITRLQTLSLEQLSLLFSRFSLLVRIVSHAAQTSFSERPFLHIDLDEQKTLTFSQLETLAIINQQAIASIETIVKHNGLSRLNIAYRNASQKLSEYKIPVIAAVAGTGITLGTFFFLLLEEEQIQNQTLKKTHRKMSQIIKKFDGAAPMLQTAGKALEVVLTLGILESFKKIFRKVDNKLRGQELLNKYTDHEYVADISLDDACFDYIRPLLWPFYRIAEFLKNPAQFAFTGLRNCQAILLIAPPGYGKSFTARAAAGLFNKSAGRTSFISISTLDLMKQMQDNAEALNGIIAEARDNAPCVLWIDEMHLLGGGLQIEKNTFILQDMLKALDALNQNADPQKMVFVIGATNRPDLLDGALLRHGRFSQIITLPEPTFNDRISLLEALCKQSAIDPRQIDLPYIARITPGASPSTLSALFEHANFLAKRENCCLGTNHLYQAINTIVRNIQPYTPYSREERTLIATQVAAEALYHACTNKLEMIDAITIRPIKEEIQEQYDWMTKIPDKKHKLFTQQRGAVFFKRTNEKVATLNTQELAGKIAQNIATKKILGQESLTPELERNQTVIFNALLSQEANNLDLKLISKQQQDLVKDRAFERLHKLECTVEEVLQSNREKLSILAKSLEEKEFLRHDEIAHLCSA
ncbi:MAG: ATP-dependent zinc metalloprotease FtsH [candidate division TM6 bacterium GW2011_GWF2_43_17]|nr:MAG: ATP-dependent zinc metalloprotease FtsH [candidate division TM6 bacterium GW2011_GWF2_43_17]